MKRKSLIFMFAVLVLGCQEPSDKGIVATNAVKKTLNADSLRQEDNLRAFEESYKVENYLISSMPSNEYITVSENAGIFISPDTLQIEQMKKSNGEETFYTVADDNIYYEYEASQFLKEKKIQVINPSTRYIKFLSKAKEFYFDTKPKAAIDWTAVLFSPDKPAPRIVNSADIEQEFQEYFK